MTQRPFIFKQKALFKHCDPAGIVFYPRYFEMINDCVETFFDHIGFPFETLHKTGAVPTAQIETVFHTSSRHGDQLTLSLDLTRIGNASLGVSVRANSGDESRFSTKLTLVHINSSGLPTQWPDQVREAFSPFIRSVQ